MFHDAVTEANEALRLDRITPHADRKLPDTPAPPARRPDPQVESKRREDAGDAHAPTEATASARYAIRRQTRTSSTLMAWPEHRAAGAALAAQQNNFASFMA